MVSGMSRVWNVAILAANGLAAALNFVIVVINWHHGPIVLVNLGAGVFSATIFGWILSRQRVKSKEETPSSPSQLPTSGTSQNPNPSQYQTGGIVSLSLTASSPSPSPSPSPSTPQPEPRAVPVVGFRAWLVTGSFKLGVGQEQRLSALNGQYGAWVPGANKAVCRAHDYDYLYYNPYGTPRRRREPHDAPSATCACGFYVLTDLDKVPFDAARVKHDGKGHVYPVDPPLVGAVVGWGRVVQHGDEGWRAEKVQVIALLDCKVDEAHLQMTREVAATYGVPVVGRKALELIAKEYGDRLS